MVLALFATWRFICILFVFAVSAVHSLTSAATTPKLARGGHTGTFRRPCAISAVAAEPAAMQKC